MYNLLPEIQVNARKRKAPAVIRLQRRYFQPKIPKAEAVRSATSDIVSSETGK